MQHVYSFLVYIVSISQLCHFHQIFFTFDFYRQVFFFRFLDFAFIKHLLQLLCSYAQQSTSFPVPTGGKNYIFFSFSNIEFSILWTFFAFSYSSTAAHKKKQKNHQPTTIQNQSQRSYILEAWDWALMYIWNFPQWLNYSCISYEPQSVSQCTIYNSSCVYARYFLYFLDGAIFVCVPFALVLDFHLFILI